MQNGELLTMMFLMAYCEAIVTDPYVCNRSPQQGGRLLCNNQDGFNYIYSGKKRTFANPKIWVVPAQATMGN
jgi:hypothetical protein